MKIIECKVNHLSEPLGFDLQRCVFSWVVEEAAGARQAAARIVVLSQGETVCDTGWADLDSLGTELSFPLPPRTAFTWTVAVRTDAGEEAVSEAHTFETAKQEEPWAGQWIGCDDSEPRHPIFSREIAPAKPVRSARLYLCGLGLYEARWNGEKIGSEYLAPDCNDYNLWVQYQTYDVTDQLQGPGTLAVELGNGWYKGRFGFEGDEKPYYGDSWKLLGELRLTYEDGTEEVIGTDESWQVTRSTIFFSNIYDGEQRDDSLPPVAPVPARKTDAPKGKLTPRHSVPVTAHEEFPVRELIHTPAGETVVDIGQNIAGIFRLRVHEPKGTRIHLQMGEILQGGNFYNENLRTAKAEYIYVSNGEETLLEPKFTFYGYRYVKIAGAEHFRPEDFTAVSLTSDIPLRGTLTTGSDLVNKLIENTRWGMKDNFVDVPTDCPQRDERMGWTGDTQVFSATALYLADAYAFYEKFLYDTAREQETTDGMVPNVVPSFGMEKSPLGCSCAWGDVATIVPWNVYLFTGDLSILRQQYPSMKGWVDYIAKVDGDHHGWRAQFHFGDWLALDNPAGGEDQMLGGTDTGLIADAYWRRSALLVAKAARLLGKDEDAAAYEALGEKILRGIREEYFTPSGRCAVDTQTAALLTLSEGLDRADRAEKALARLMDLSGGKLKTGFVGTPLLCRVLADHGMEKLAYGLLLNEEYPGWLYEVKMGATTVWERWNSVNPDGSISSTGMNSLNHYAYGSVVEWVFSHCAGLRPVEEAPGFRKALIRPILSWELRKLSMAYPSPAGLYKVSWEAVDKKHVRLSVTVPFGCEAELTLPLSGREPLTLTAGTYDYQYETVKYIGGVLSTEDPIAALLANEKTRKLLEEAFPQALMIPGPMQGSSLRALAASQGSVSPEELDRLDEVLGQATVD